jgi:hypothetical protein
MESKVRRTFAALLLISLVAAAPALADSNTQTDVGLFTAVLAGTHVGSDNPVPVSGVVPGAAIEVTQHLDFLRIHLEGIPTVSANGTNSGPFGRSSASLDLLNSTIMADIDPHGRYRLGGGYQLVNLTNTNGSNGDRNKVRISSPIYAAGATLPLPSDHFVELNLMVDPNLRGTLLVFNYLGQAHTNKPEQGAEVDYSGAYGWRHRNVEYLLGFRGLSYHTRNTITDELVDRNTGGGVTFEARFLFGK